MNAFMKRSSEELTGNTSLSEFCAEGTTYEASYILLSNNIRLRKITFTPELQGQLPEILFLPGLASIIENFRDLMKALTKNFKVHYLESREKKSSIVPDGSSFAIPDHALDIAEAAYLLFGDHRKFIIIGFSFGASTAAEAMPLMKNKPVKLILTEPVATFRFPELILFLARYLVPFYRILKPVVKWRMRRGHINMAEDYEMYVINSRTIDNASPQKLSSVVLAIADYNMENDPPKIDVPTVIICASKDKFHSYDEALRIAAGIKGCTCVDMGTNKRTHGAELADWLVNHLETS